MGRKQEKERQYTLRKVKEGYFRKYNQKLRKEVFVKLGDKCAWCGFADPRALQIDHVFNDGYAERKETRNQNQRMRKVLLDKEGRYQILCANCNSIKRYRTIIEKWGNISG